MGDVLTLIEKAEAAFDAKKAAELEQKLKSNKFTLSDFYDQLSQLKNMGSLDEIAAMMPGMNAGALKGAQVAAGEIAVLYVLGVPLYLFMKKENVIGKILK